MNNMYLYNTYNIIWFVFRYYDIMLLLVIGDTYAKCKTAMRLIKLKQVHTDSLSRDVSWMIIRKYIGFVTIFIRLNILVGYEF